MYGEEEDDEEFWMSSSRKKNPFFDDDDDDGFAKNFAAQSRKSQIMDEDDDNDSLGALTGQANNDYSTGLQYFTNWFCSMTSLLAFSMV